MVGIVIVSHSKNLADSVVEFTGLMAPDAKIAAAGGMEDGGFGTSCWNGSSIRLPTVCGVRKSIGVPSTFRISPVGIDTSSIGV